MAQCSLTDLLAAGALEARRHRIFMRLCMPTPNTFFWVFLYYYFMTTFHHLCFRAWHVWLLITGRQETSHDGAGSRTRRREGWAFRIVSAITRMCSPYPSSSMCSTMQLPFVVRSLYQEFKLLTNVSIRNFKIEKVIYILCTLIKKFLILYKNFMSFYTGNNKFVSLLSFISR